MPTRKERARETEELIFTKSMELVKEKGFDNITIGEIAEACGIAKGTVYLYFKSKDDLLIYLSIHPFFKNTEELLEQMKGLSTYEKLKCVTEKWFDAMEDAGPNLGRQWLHFNANPRRYEIKGNNDTVDYGYQLIYNIIRDGISTGELVSDTPIDFLTAFIMTIQLGTDLYWCRCDGQYTGSIKENYGERVLLPVLKPYLSPAM